MTLIKLKENYKSGRYDRLDAECLKYRQYLKKHNFVFRPFRVGNAKGRYADLANKKHRYNGWHTAPLSRYTVLRYETFW